MEKSTSRERSNLRTDSSKFVAVETVKAYSLTNAKVDYIFAKNAENLDSFERARAEAIVMSWLRNKILIDFTLSKLFSKKPKPRVANILVCVAADILSSDKEKLAKVVHSWVEFAKQSLSKFEVNFINAVARKISSNIESILNKSTGLELLSLKYGHPLWLVERWVAEFGEEKTTEILKSNSKNSSVFFRKDFSSKAEELSKEYTDCFETTKFPNFLKLKNGMWKKAKELLETSSFYVQDPSTFFAPKQFAPKSGGTYLDLCASPGGKSRTIADIIKSDNPQNLKSTLLVSSDTKKRIGQLKDNIKKIDSIKTAVIECDLLSENLAQKLSENNLPTLFDGVFVDAPCSNTGVLGRRPDARYRLSAKDITECAKKQLNILNVAKDFVKIGGKLEYSTCSIEAEENVDNIKRFLEENKNFKLLESMTIFPSSDNDGAGCALFERLF